MPGNENEIIITTEKIKQNKIKTHKKTCKIVFIYRSKNEERRMKFRIRQTQHTSTKQNEKAKRCFQFHNVYYNERIKPTNE